MTDGKEATKPYFEPFRTNGMLIASPSMAELYSVMSKLARSNVSVLILGETGVGKELVARELHSLSGRQGNFVAINCAGIPESLLETTLFGHVRGAFTDAIRETEGKLQYANNGTVFFDEIGEMRYHTQGKLLRVLEDKLITKVGGHREIEVDVRVLSATNGDLARALDEETFRKDLYYRLNVVTLSVPPLRQRMSEVPYLVQLFLIDTPEKKANLFQSALRS
ncbi:MAG: sigma-54 factor interaction domain-containing protein [Nanoarchaeota archaeon]